MRTHSSLLVSTTGIAVLLVAALLVGCGTNLSTQSSGGRADMPVAAETGVSSYGGGSVGAPQSSKGALSADSVAPGATPDAQPMVVSTSSISLEVKNLDSAVSAIRALAAKYGASIANLSTNAGTTPLPTPQPVDGSSNITAPTPGGATITLRIPAAQLGAAEKEAATLGRVISQSSSQDDVTQQHVDMKARLKNLQAEEARLRTFFLKAKRVSEMLAIEQELSRVRGEIESMQAQITYLERQTAMATLTIALSEPGALVSPASGGWGFAQAFRDGVRAAAYVLRGLITVFVMLLGFSPLLVIGLVLFFLIRALARRGRRARESAEANDAEPRVQPSDEQ